MSLTIKFYQDSQPHTCSYLENRLAQNIYPDPNYPMSNKVYSQLIQFGFRRSGNHSYRPHCEGCQACIPVRINVNKFTPNRAQRRCLKRNQHLMITSHPAEFNPEHFELYSRYLNTRHPDGGMDNPTKESYTHFLTSFWSDTQFLEFRNESQLLGVAVTDFVDDGLSAFYTFFDPEFNDLSLGTYAILKQIEMARSQRCSSLYLGYWVADCRKMQYKQSFSALEAYQDQQWQTLKT
mgnify:FL=1